MEYIGNFRRCVHKMVTMATGINICEQNHLQMTPNNFLGNVTKFQGHCMSTKKIIAERTQVKLTVTNYIPAGTPLYLIQLSLVNFRLNVGSS